MTRHSFELGIKQRFQLMMRHTYLMGAAGLLALVGVAIVAHFVMTRPITLKVAVGPPNSDDLKAIQAIAAQFARDRASIRLATIAVDGPVEAAAAIDSGQADFAMIRRDVAV